VPSLYVKGVYFINLDIRPDRLENMHKQLSSCKWDVTRVPAVRLEKEPAEIGYKLIPRLEGKKHVLSIWLSHRKALELALTNVQNEALILLEDDVKIDSTFWKDKLELPEKLPENWEILFFSPRFRVNKNGPLKNQTGSKWLKAPFGKEPVLLNSVRSKYVCTGAHFVVFRNSSVIKKVIEKMDSMDEIYDVDLFYLGSFKTFGIDNPKITTNSSLGSDHH
tara:strand:+ start:1352 stop:2014 length:663 start_codon:yes stop_codon:yes gene_type:complete